jgi:hypothetical protein
MLPLLDVVGVDGKRMIQVVAMQRRMLMEDRHGRCGRRNQSQSQRKNNERQALSYVSGVDERRMMSLCVTRKRLFRAFRLEEKARRKNNNGVTIVSDAAERDIGKVIAMQKLTLMAIQFELEYIVLSHTVGNWFNNGASLSVSVYISLSHKSVKETEFSHFYNSLWPRQTFEPLRGQFLPFCVIHNSQQY